MEENRIYELGYLAIPTIPEASVADAVVALTKVITDNKGTVHTQSDAEYIDLTYTITVDHVGKKAKWDSAYFGSFKFEIEPEAIAAVQKALDANMDIVRYLLTKTSLDNQIVFKKVASVRRDAKKDIEEDPILAEILADDAEVVEEEVALEAHEQLPALEITE